MSATGPEAAPAASSATKAAPQPVRYRPTVPCDPCGNLPKGNHSLYMISPKEPNPFLRGVPTILDALRSGQIECRGTFDPLRDTFDHDAELAGSQGALMIGPAFGCRADGARLSPGTGLRAALLLLLLAASACTPRTSGDAAAQELPSWPGEEWPVSTPEAEGVDPVAIDALVADIDAGRYGLIDHFLLIRNGRVIADHRWDQSERYLELLTEQEDTTEHQYNYDHPAWHPYYRGTDLHTLQSVTKSVMSVAFGIAVDAGHISGVDAAAWPFLERYRPDPDDPGRAAATLADFLTMRSGIDWALPGQTYDDDTHPTSILEASDAWIDYVAGRPIGTDPGTCFDYNDGVSVLLGKILREATGQRIDEWAREHLFGPIGIDEYHWKITPDGEADSEGGLYLATHDLARVGYLMLRGGVWEGRQVISEDWVRVSTSPVVPDIAPDNDRSDMGYGYQWWVPVQEDGQSRIFAGNGYGGQFLHVVPEHDLISVFNGWTLHQRPEMSSWMAMQQRILPAVRR